MTHRTFAALVVAAAAGLAAPSLATAQEGSRAITFSKDVAPIVQQNCQICHQPGQIGPMSLITYQDVRRYSRRIKDLVVNREMPPYQYDTDVGVQHLQNDWRLSEAEIQTIADWVDAGSPEGNPADLPARCAAHPAPGRRWRGRQPHLRAPRAHEPPRPAAGESPGCSDTPPTLRRDRPLP